MVSNRDLQEINEWYEAKSNPFYNFLKQTSPAVIISLIGLFLIGWYVISKSKVNTYVVLGIIGVLVLVMIFRQRKVEERLPIPLPIITIMAVSIIERRIGYAYPAGTRVYPSKYARMRHEGHWGDKYVPWKWEVGVIVIEPNLLRRDELVLMEPFTGGCEGVVARPAGYTGELANDVKILVPNYSVAEQKPAVK